MPQQRTKTETVYTYAELSPEAQAKARQWWQLCEAEHCDLSDVIECLAVPAAEILGISFDQRKGMGNNPAVYYQGFSSQGDGACFEGGYSYAKQSVAKIKKEFPTDETIHQIAKDLQAIQKRHFYQLEARTSHRGHYYHSGCMAVDVGDQRDQYRDIGDAEDVVRQALRDFADWIYDRLEQEYEYRTSDQNAAENIEANDYEFYEDGSIA